jgi:hypothetical protein
MLRVVTCSEETRNPGGPARAVITIALSWGLRGRVAIPSVSITSLLTVLMVFVIVRIFQAGNRMREDLEGTV